MYDRVHEAFHNHLLLTHAADAEAVCALPVGAAAPVRALGGRETGAVLGAGTNASRVGETRGNC